MSRPDPSVETPRLPLSCFSGRLEHLLDAELADRWRECGPDVEGDDPSAAADAAADRAVYAGEIERRRDLTTGRTSPPR